MKCFNISHNRVFIIYQVKAFNNAKRKYGFICASHFGRLVLLNLLFILFCLPIITIPAAICGLSRVLLKLIREGYSFEWKAYFKELKSDFAIRLLLWFPLGGLYVVTVLFSPVSSFANSSFIRNNRCAYHLFFCLYNAIGFL